jgi:hypothetical protein
MQMDEISRRGESDEEGVFLYGDRIAGAPQQRSSPFA